MASTTTPRDVALSADELALIDAYWRAANYLSRRPDLPAGQPAAARAAAARARQAAAARPLGHDARAEPHLRAPEPGHQGPRPRHDLRLRPGPRRARRSSRTPTSKAPTASSTRRSARTRTACASCSASSPSPAASRATSAPETPGSIHEGGELGYSLAHAYGAAFDNPDLVVACVVGDGEAETGPLATSWHSNKFLEPGARRRRAADPAPERLQDRQPDGARPDPARTSSTRCSRATATSRTVVEGDDPADVHQQLAGDARRGARRDPPRSRRRPARTASRERPRWPMIVLRTPKGWTGPKERRRRAGRGHVARPPGAARRARDQPGAPGACSRRGCGATGPRSCSTRTGAPARGARRAGARRATGG